MKLLSFTILAILLNIAVYSQTVVFSENFESITPPDLPSGWTQEKVVGLVLVEWETLSGGHSGNPASASEGSYNAIFQYQSSNGEATKLISPVIDLSEVSKPELRFDHAQDIWFAGEEDWDQLRVYYKRGADSAWVMLEEYLYPVEDWEERAILLPDSSLCSTYYIAFEGITGYGHGVVIDDIQIVETGVIPLYIESVSIKQAQSGFIPTGTDNNPVIRIEINVQGNDGVLTLDSIAFESNNTSDSDISTNGVKIFATNDTIFDAYTQLGSGNFSAGKITFDNLNHTLNRGLTTVWLTYDIKTDVSHELHGNVADALIRESAIKINNSYYPFLDQSPNGSREIYETVFFDDFETDKGWRLKGDFVRGTPQGLKGDLYGSPDPEEAFSGSNVIGNDLAGDGNYANSVVDTANVAQLPTFNFKYYKDIQLTFYRWLNVESYIFDRAKILVNNDTDTIWDEVWGNPTLAILNENIWNYHTYDLSPYFEREPLSKLKFTLGPTNSTKNYSGWNIDDVIIVGDFISKDVGITEWIAPLDGCGHTDEEYVNIKIQNYAGEILNDPLPVSYSFDGGETIAYDTITNPNIAIDGFLIYQIDKPIDLSTPGWYNNVYARTHLPGDEDNTNNRIDISIFITPTYGLPYYEDFETNYGYYLSGGINSTWEYGTPAATLIDAAASGTKAWVTNLTGEYDTNDSSYLESPCFNFSGSDSIIFEFKCKGISEDKTDGLSLLYSLDEGETWDLVPDDGDFYWNWYTEANISDLELPGIDTTNGEWLTFRQILPLAVTNQSSVKFKFVFESNDNTNDEGFGIDDIRIYDAPDDVGISTISEPVTACEIGANTLVKVFVENYGITTIPTDTKIPLTLKFNSDIINDTLTLASDLLSGNNILFTFGTNVDMSYAGDFDFTVYTKFESDTYFYNETVSNDTIYDTISVTGMPNYNPFNDQMGDAAPIDTFLVAGEGFTTYTWGDSIPNDLAPNDTLFVQYPGWYEVTVENGVGCTSHDSVEVVSSLIDMKMDSLFTVRADSCERNELTELIVRITHNSLSDLTPLDTIWMAYQINENTVVEDTLILTEDFVIGTTELFTYTEKCDLRTPGIYNVKVFTNVLKDLDHSDDTLTRIFNTNGYVEIDLNYDTAYSSQADTLDLVATAGYLNYTWNTAETNDSIKPPNNLSNWFYVTVTDNFACGSDSDSVFVQTYDFGINSVINPVSDCGHTTTEPIQVSIHNYSGNTYLTGTKIPFRFDFNGAGWINDTATLVSDLGSGIDRTLTLTNTVNPNIDGSYSFIIEVDSDQDANSLNDSFDGAFETYGYPEVTLPYDTIYTAQADTVVLIAQSGFATYNWSNGTSNDTLNIARKDSEKYVVTAEDNYGCITSKDSTQIITYNLSLSTMVSPKIGCSHTATEAVLITVKNSGYDTLKTGAVIPVAYIMNEGSVINENFVLGSDLRPSETANYEFVTTEDLSAISTYKFKVYTDFEFDVYRANDTLVDAIKTFGYPSTEIGTDIYTTQPDTVELVAEQGFYGYFWNTGIQNDTLIVTYPATKLYRITVSDLNGCTASDELTVYTYNITTDSLINPPHPYETCDALSDEPIIIQYINSSKDTLLVGESISFSYSINSGSAVNGSHVLTEILYPDSTGEFEFTQTADLLESITYEFNIVSRKTTNDADTDDALIKDVNINAPIVDLGSDTVYFTTNVELEPTDSYISYSWSTGETTPSIVVNESGTYKVTVVNAEGCTGFGQIEAVNTTGIDNIVQGEDYKITYFPNPATEKLNLVFENKKSTDVIIEIININGGIIYNNKLSDVLNEVKQIDVNPFTSGVYFIRFRIDDEYYLKKLIIQ